MLKFVFFLMYHPQTSSTNQTTASFAAAPTHRYSNSASQPILSWLLSHDTNAASSPWNFPSSSNVHAAALGADPSFYSKTPIPSVALQLPTVSLTYITNVQCKTMRIITMLLPHISCFPASCCLLHIEGAPFIAFYGAAPDTQSEVAYTTDQQYVHLRPWFYNSASTSGQYEHSTTEQPKT